MNNLSPYISTGFMLITAIAVAIFYYATKRNKIATGLILLLMLIQAVLAQNGFFLETGTVPPRIFFSVLPSLILIIFAFATRQGRAFTDSIRPETYIWLHTVRIAVECVLFALFTQAYVPESMTFEGRNFDIISGLSAPFIAWFGFRKKRLSGTVLITWNILCLALVLQVVITGILSVPSAIQTQAFDQPNVAVLYFPFIWLPGIVVPLVIYGHLAVLRQLIKSRS